MLNKKDLLIFSILLVAGIAGCNRNMTCPAFQSQYLIDEQARHDQFTLFNPDSTPRYDGYVKKNKHGLGVQKSYVRKTNEMRTIPMVKVYPQVSDSIGMLHSSDSSRIDSAGNRPSPYMTVVNNDQLIYNALFGAMLMKKKQQKENMSEELKAKPDSVSTGEESTGKKKSIFNIFRKKDKQEAEPAEENSRPQPKKQNQRIVTPPANTAPADTINQDDGF
jgi:hypothetical protein